MDDYRDAMSQYATGMGFEGAKEAVTDWAMEQALRLVVPGAVYAIAKKYAP